jgi:hypothetical protein
MFARKDKLSCADDVLRMYESVLNGVNNRTLLASLPPFYLHKYNAGDTPTRMHGDNKPIWRGCRNPANHLRMNRQPQNHTISW